MEGGSIYPTVFDGSEKFGIVPLSYALTEKLYVVPGIIVVVVLVVTDEPRSVLPLYILYPAIWLKPAAEATHLSFTKDLDIVSRTKFVGA